MLLTAVQSLESVIDKTLHIYLQLQNSVVVVNLNVIKLKESKSEADRGWVEEEEKMKGGCDNGFILHTGETKAIFFLS